MTSLTTSHPVICDFYNNHSHIDFESMNVLLVNFLEKLHNSSDKTQHNTIINQFQHWIQNQGHTSLLHCESEFTLTRQLTQLFPTADIKKGEVDDQHSQSIFMKRFRKPTVYCHWLDQEDNVSKDQMLSIHKQFSQYGCCGIYLSHKSGFIDKKDYQLDVHNNQLVIYLHNLSINPDKLEQAFQMIDHLMLRWNEITNEKESTEISITKDCLERINNEYQLFLSQKSSISDLLKDTHKKLNQQLDDIKFPFLEDYLSGYYCAPVRSNGLKCDICKNYNANNLKALAAHKRGCLRKHPNIGKNNKENKENIRNTN